MGQVEEMNALAKELADLLMGRIDFFIDTGAPRTYVVKEVQKENACCPPRLVNVLIDLMVSTGKLTEATRTTDHFSAGWLVVTDWNPRTAEKIQRLNGES